MTHSNLVCFIDTRPRSSSAASSFAAPRPKVRTQSLDAACGDAKTLPGAPPQDVLGGPGPLVLDQIRDLRRVKPGPEVLAEVSDAAAAGEQGMDVGAVVADAVTEKPLRHP